MLSRHSPKVLTPPLPPRTPLHPLGTILVLSFITTPPSDYPNTSQPASLLPVQPLHCHPRTLSKKHTLSPLLLQNLCGVFLTHGLPKSGSNFCHQTRLLPSFSPFLYFSHALNLEVKFMDFRVGQSGFKSWLRYLPAVGPWGVS